ncbi:MAG: 2-oxoacid:ferredoxin oxidoreductase subunit beta [Acidimicrobiia bacterium]
MTETAARYTRQDFQSDQEVRWCPGCGDYTILATVQSLLAGLDMDRHNHVFVSGIGCAARFPYYLNTYGMHSIHGRAPAIATGVATANPDLTVWVVTGDGDSLSIGGNHLIHALRRNVDIKILMFNNQIYGLTKGQYSPTSEVGKLTKSSPMGSIDYPFNPVSLALGAEATFVARTIDMDRGHSTRILQAAYEHKGSAFVEIYQNCNVFNDKAFIQLTGKEERDANRIYLEPGQPIVFGTDNERGVVLDSNGASIVDVADVGIDAIHVHDPSNTGGVAYSLSRLAHGPNGPTPIGVFRSVARPSYRELVQSQIVTAQAQRGPGNLAELLRSAGTWSVS